LIDRLRGYLRDQGYSTNQVEAVVARNQEDMHLVLPQLAAVQAFMQMPEAATLAAANKRIGNILRKSESEIAPAVDRALLAPGPEQDLHTAVEALMPVVVGHVDRGHYTDALRSLASVRGSVDRFFEDVMVMDEDASLRANRLALLRGLSDAMNQVADLSKLAS
jgi:glycyl-tRNA synthetase beta chain